MPACQRADVSARDMPARQRASTLTCWRAAVARPDEGGVRQPIALALVDGIRSGRSSGLSRSGGGAAPRRRSMGQGGESWYGGRRGPRVRAGRRGTGPAPRPHARPAGRRARAGVPRRAAAAGPPPLTPIRTIRQLDRSGPVPSILSVDRSRLRRPARRRASRRRAPGARRRGSRFFRQLIVRAWASLSEKPRELVMTWENGPRRERCFVIRVLSATRPRCLLDRSGPIVSTPCCPRLTARIEARSTGLSPPALGTGVPNAVGLGRCRPRRHGIGELRRPARRRASRRPAPSARRRTPTTPTSAACFAPPTACPRPTTATTPAVGRGGNRQQVCVNRQRLPSHTRA
jgi:hypothetical protein